MSSQKIEKVIIIGSGPAGYTAAVYTSRALLSPLMFEGEQIGGQLMLTTEVENYPGFAKGITGPELMEVLRQQAERFETRFISQNVTKVDFSSRPFKVWQGDQLYLARSVIIATGASAKYMGLENERRLMAKGVSACATCDGAFFRNVKVAIVGGGDTAMEEALFLTRYASEVIVVHRRDHFRASKIMAEKVMKHPKIRIIWDTAVEDVLGDKLVSGLKLKNLKTGQVSQLDVEGMFVAIGHQPNTAVFDKQLRTNEIGYLVTEPGSTYTSIEGVFAAGDVQDHVYRQAITAAGSGCMAAIDCERWLAEHHAE
jgi:thioredoxin reductase (NADPH)